MPVSIVVVQLENSEMEVEERKDTTLFLLHLAQHQETQEITQTDMEVQGSGANEVEVRCVDGKKRAIPF